MLNYELIRTLKIIDDYLITGLGIGTFISFLGVFFPLYYNVTINDSDAYLKSVNCMYKVTQLMKDDNWEEKVMYVVEDNANGIYDAIKQLEYIGYWENKSKELLESLKGYDPAIITEQSKELNKINIIKLHIGEFMCKVKNTSNPEIKVAVDAVVDRVRRDS